LRFVGKPSDAFGAFEIKACGHQEGFGILGPEFDSLFEVVLRESEFGIPRGYFVSQKPGKGVFRAVYYQSFDDGLGSGFEGLFRVASQERAVEFRRISQAQVDEDTGDFEILGGFDVGFDQ
jgi:hypothetical protein